MGSQSRLAYNGNSEAESRIARQVTDTAREALKQIVGQNMLPWPDIYSAEFWQTAHKSGYDDILLRQHNSASQTEQLAQDFLEKADEILGGVNDTVTSFVAGTRNHTEEMASTLENLKQIPVDNPEVGRGLEKLLDTNLKLQSRSQEVEDKLAEQTRIINELQNQLRSDPLTGLLNRGALNNDLKKELAKARRYKYPVAIFMADIDHFKNVNDVYGHLVGDSVLKITAQLLQQGIREADSAYRYGGEEFLMLLPHTSADNAMILADRIRERIANYLFVDKKNDISISLTISAGVTEFRPDDTETTFIARADKALYLAKQNGRNQVIKQ